MRPWSQYQWNGLLAGVLLAGSLFMWATRMGVPGSAAHRTEGPTAFKGRSGKKWEIEKRDNISGTIAVFSTQ